MKSASRHRLLAAAGLAALSLGAAASAASAAPYEQINRATGAFGAAPLFETNGLRGTAVGDVGRFAGWELQRSHSGTGLYESSGFVRDIQSNTTYDYGGGVRRVYSIDRAERRALILRTRSGQQQVVAVPITGGTPIIVAQFPDTVDVPNAALSGDGRKAVVSQRAWGTKVFDLTSGAARLVRTLAAATGWSFQLGSRSVSDDASTIAVSSGEYALFVGSKRLAVDALNAPVVDPSGRYAAWVSAQRGVVLRDLVSGVERIWTLPEDPPARGQAQVAWLSTGGTKIAVAAEGYGKQFWSGAKVVTTATGVWSAFGDRFASSIVANYLPTPISANGLFALSGPPAITLMQTSGQHIVGANEGLAAGAYLWAGSFVNICAEPATFSVSMRQPFPFVPAPVKTVVTVKQGTKLIASGTLTNALPFDAYFLPDDRTGWQVSGDYDARGPEIKLTATVTDGAGRVLTESWTEPDPFCGG